MLSSVHKHRVLSNFLNMLKLYGERNTGTNYLLKLIQLNLNVELLRSEIPKAWKHWQQRLPGKEWLRDVYFMVHFKDNLGWKHMAVPPVTQMERFERFHDPKLHFLTLTKNPYAWLLSLHKRPYHHDYPGIKPDFETFIQTPWTTVLRDGLSQKVLSSPVELWNLKVASYEHLPSERTLHLRSVDVIANPEVVLSEIAEAFGMSRKQQEFVNYEESTKDKSKDADWYGDYYSNERWQDQLSPRSVALINSYLDVDLVRKRGFEVLE
jgi:hypothetical protein